MKKIVLLHAVIVYQPVGYVRLQQIIPNSVVDATGINYWRRFAGGRIEVLKRFVANEEWNDERNCSDPKEAAIIF